jgi:hypothetical protein
LKLLKSTIGFIGIGLAELGPPGLKPINGMLPTLPRDTGKIEALASPNHAGRQGFGMPAKPSDVKQKVCSKQLCLSFLSFIVILFMFHPVDLPSFCGLLCSYSLPAKTEPAKRSQGTASLPL